MSKLRVLVTGAAGFIGFHLTEYLLKSNYEVIGIDNLNDYYDVALKKDRLSVLNESSDFKFVYCDISNSEELISVFDKYKPFYVINLAAQAGVRYSITNPKAYVDSNLVGFMNVLEACRRYPVNHLIYASSSSVYGGNSKVPFSTEDNVDHPVSLYAATKKSNELLAHSYSHLYDIPTTGLRFFTVYGPYGRPDMAYYSFTQKIINGDVIEVFNNGNLERDFTYVDDIVECINLILTRPPKKSESWNEKDGKTSESFAPYKIYNIGNNNPVKLMDFIRVIESKVGKTAKFEYKEMQLGDVLKTYADISDLYEMLKFKPSTNIEEGISKFVNWYKSYYNIKK